MTPEEHKALGHKRAGKCILCRTKLYKGEGGPIGGGTVTLSFGYGSIHDTEYKQSIICDHCAAIFLHQK